MARKNTVENAEELEDMAVQTILEVMGNTQYGPDVRLEAATRALRALGKADPTASKAPSIVLNFGDHVAKSLLGVGTALELMKPAPEQQTEPARAES